MLSVMGRGVGKTTAGAAAKGAAAAATKTVIKGVGAAAVAMLRRVLAKLVSGSALKFTVTTAAHMATKGRHVPIQILQMAIKHGVKSADPQGVKGVVMYTIKMSKYVGQAGKPFKEYSLEVVLRESDNTVLHFLYK